MIRETERRQPYLMPKPQTTLKPKRTISASEYMPAADFMILEPELEAEVSEGGILIPAQARRMLNEGRVIKIGPLVSPEFAAMFNQQGDLYVAFSPATEYRFELEKGVVVIAVREQDITLWRREKKPLFQD